MFLLASLAFVAMLAAGLAAGLRLLAAAARTHKDPELWIGLATLTAALGGGVEIASTRLDAAGQINLGFGLQALGRGLYVTSTAALYVGTWRIFRPDRAWAQVLAFAGSMAAAAAWGAFVAGSLHSREAGPSATTFLIQVTRMGPFAWAAAESFAYRARMQRRRRLGLADPVIAHQFLLWGIASSAMVALLLVVIASYSATGTSPLDIPLGLLGLAVCGITGAATIYTAFFPPAFYRRWTAARAAASPA